MRPALSLTLATGLLACREAPAPPPVAADDPDAMRFEVTVPEFGPTGVGPIEGATVTLYDAADLDAPAGRAVTNRLGVAAVPLHPTRGVWVAHVSAPGHHDTWYWGGGAAGPDFAAWNGVPLFSDADWELARTIAELPRGAALVAPGLPPDPAGTTLRTEPPALAVRYGVDGQTLDPTLTSSPVGMAIAAVRPGPVELIGTSQGRELRARVVAHADAIVALDFPEPLSVPAGEGGPQGGTGP